MAVSEQRREPGPGLAPAGERVDRLLEIALALFARKDYAAVSIKDLAAASGVSTSLIYYYFENKRHLFAAAAEHAIETARSSYQNMVGGQRGAVDRINDWFQVNVEMQDSLRLLVRIMFNYAGNATEPGLIEDKIAQFYEFERGLLAEGIAQGVREGTFRAVDAGRIAHFVSIHLDGIFHAVVVQKNFEVADAVETLKQALWQILGVRAASGTPDEGQKKG